MSAPVPIFGTQDLHDDDGQVIDSFLIETDAPPPIAEAMEPITIPAPIELPKPTRFICGTEIITLDSQPFQLLPADADRREFQISVTAPTGTVTATDYVNVASDLGPVSSARLSGAGTGVMRLRPNAAGTATFDLDAYTGPVYISGNNSAAPQTISLEVVWRAVTS